MPYLHKDKPFESMTRLLRGWTSADELGAAIGKSSATARQRIKNPGDLTLNELAAICKRLHIPKEELMGAVRF